MNNKGAATISPNIVVTNAWDIPPAISFGSPVPNKVIAWNVSIIPITVPSNPNNGATVAINLIALTLISIVGVIDCIFSSRISSRESKDSFTFSLAVCSSDPKRLSWIISVLFSCSRILSNVFLRT